MAINIFLDKGWQEKHLNKTKLHAGNRYTPNRNIELPIVEVFDGIRRSKKFYGQIFQKLKNLIQSFNFISDIPKNSDKKELYDSFNIKIQYIIKALENIGKYNSVEIDWDNINRNTQEAYEALSSLTLLTREEKKDHISNDDFNKLTYHFNAILRILKNIMAFSVSSKAKLSNLPFLFLSGEAGTGKTHLLCDILEAGFENDQSFPGVLVFGDQFNTSDDPIDQIVRELNLEMTKDQFLQSLNDAGKNSNCRSILAIDALNETANRDYWKNNLIKLLNEVNKYPNLALVISIRAGFEEEIFNEKTREAFVFEIHQGFAFREWEAVTRFFKEFDLPLPEVPLLMPEFQNPLFLLLFCMAYEHRKRENKNCKKQRQILKGHEGATYIFENFVGSISKKIYQQFNIPTSNNRKIGIWNTVIKGIVANMVENGRDEVSEAEVILIIEKEYPSINPTEFLKALEKNLLIRKKPLSGKNSVFHYEFAFQKFSDHLIARYIFKQYEDKFDKGNKNLQNGIEFFSRKKLKNLLCDPWSRGLIEALAVQCPEHFDGYELVDLAPYLKRSDAELEAFIKSIIWRKPTAFSKNTLDYINIISKKNYRIGDLLNALLTVAPIENHPLNADFLHDYLSEFSMSDRDANWSIFLHKEYGKRDAVDRLLAWAWSDQNKTHISDEGIRLCSISLGWMLTTPNRFVRDKATKALVTILTNRLPVILTVLKQFSTVNDPYVTERLYAVAYGCVIRSSSDNESLAPLSQWVYDKIFKNGSPPVHILIREYARGVIETALHVKINLDINRQMILPPFNSDWPNEVPDAELLNTSYPSGNRIWSSVMYNFGQLADFGNYVINSSLHRFSAIKLNNNELSRKRIFANFKKDLTPIQLSFLDQSKERLINQTLGYLPIQYKSDKNEITIRDGYNDFISSLDEEGKNFFDNEIGPFLGINGEIAEPNNDFDNGFAQRWIFNKVMQLGWDYRLHGEFDDTVNWQCIGRSEHKAERIGKKYQWIALHELLARVSDNFELKEELESNNNKKYLGAWQLGIKDIDPSCILKYSSENKPEELPVFKNITINSHAFNKEITNLDWIKSEDDLPSLQQIIEFCDEKNNYWINLASFITWQEEHPPGQESYGNPMKNIGYVLKSYLVACKDKNKIFSWAINQNFYGRWMPESDEFYDTHLGTYPWYPALHYEDEWINEVNDTKLPTKILVTDRRYLSNGAYLDCATDETIKVTLPIKLIVDGMKLEQSYVDGRFFDSKGTLAAFDPHVFDYNMPNCLLIRKNKFIEFLEANGYALFWTLLGEKNVIDSHGTGQALGKLEVTGAATLSDNESVIESRTRKFFPWN